MPLPNRQAAPKYSFWIAVGIQSVLITLILLVTPSWSAADNSTPVPERGGSPGATGTQYTLTKTPPRPSLPPNWSRFPITLARGRRLRVLIYGRYSTDEQDPRSIEDQAGYCRHFLEALGLTDVDLEIKVLCDRGMSGELIFRPGIDQVREGIEAKLWDLILVEDSSRLFRDFAAGIELVRMAVDQGIRVIAINDEVDTADEENWGERLYEAGRHHAKTNQYTSKRIKRTHEALWDMGAAIGKLKPGYRRVPFSEGTGTEPARGPFRDELDPKWQSIMEEAYERIARHEPPWLVGQFLTENKFPKAGGALTQENTAKDVVALIPREDHRGVQKFRKTVSKKLYRKGKRKSERNDPAKILVRQMPHLRVVPDALWIRANNAIADRRRNRKDPSKGRDHPLAGISRDARGPLSGVFVCGRCLGKLYVDGRADGGYRCRNARSGKCWNKATSLRLFCHQEIGNAIIVRLRSLDQELDRLVEQVRDAFNDHGLRRDQREQCQQTEREALEALENLAKVAEKAKELPDIILERIKHWQDKLDRARADQEYLDRQEQLMAVPTRAELDQRIAQLLPQLKEMQRTVRWELKALVGRIEAVPCLQFGGNKVVLRARFELNLIGLLPPQVRAALAGLCDAQIDKRFGTIPMLVDLFEPSTGPQYGLVALKLAEEGLGLTAIGGRLGITKRKANIAVQYGRELRAAGLTDPYSELSEPPADVSRWRTHPSQSPRQDDNAAQS